jgi:hypothetical protein
LRNSAQTAADAAALAAARGGRDGIEGKFLDALKAGDLGTLKGLLNGPASTALARVPPPVPMPLAMALK